MNSSQQRRGRDPQPYVSPYIPQPIPDPSYREYVADKRQAKQPMSDYKAYMDTTRGSAQHFGRVRGTDGEWLKGPDDRYIRQYPDPTDSQLGQLDPGYMRRHPSEEDLPNVQRKGSRAVYGEYGGEAIHGPAQHERFFTDWADIGAQYDPSATPFLSGKPIPLNEDEFMRDKGFKFKKEIGTGGYGSVWLVKASKLFKDSKGEYIIKEIACKVMNIEMFERFNWTLAPSVRKLVAEATVHSDLKHINIVECHHVYYTHDPHTGFPYCRCFMFMELCKGDLKKIMRKQWSKHFNERQAFEMFDQVSAGLLYLHKQSITHMDLKIYNVLYVKKEKKLVYKLSDFGLSLRFNWGQQPTITGRIGTGIYMPPEMKRVPAMTWNAYLADIYCLALILAESLSGVMKYNAFLDKISYGNCTPTALKKLGIRQSCADLINKMTEDIPYHRPDIYEVRQHQWFVDMRN